MKTIIPCIVLLAVSGVLIFVAPVDAKTTPSFELRLERLAKLLEQKRHEYHVPGLAEGIGISFWCSPQNPLNFTHFCTSDG